MDELGDLFSKPKPPVYFAKKSDPASAAVKRERQSEEVGAEAVGPEPLRCGQCSKVFKKKCNLVLHMEKVHQVGIDAVYSESVPIYPIAFILPPGCTWLLGQLDTI